MDSYGAHARNGRFGRTYRRNRRRVEHAAVIGLKDLHDQADDAARREELAAFLPFRARELAEEIFVDPAEGVVFERLGNLGNLLEQLLEQRAVENLIRAWQYAGEMRIVLFDIRYRIVDFLADIGAFRQVEQMVISRVRRQIDYAFGVISTRLIDSRRTSTPVEHAFSNSRTALSESSFREAKKNQPENRRRILCRRHPEFARSCSAASQSRFSRVLVAVSFSDGAIHCITKNLNFFYENHPRQ